MRSALNHFGVERLAWVSEAPYEAERLAFRACEYLAGLRSSPHLGATFGRASFAA